MTQPHPQVIVKYEVENLGPDNAHVPTLVLELPPKVTFIRRVSLAAFCGIFVFCVVEFEAGQSGVGTGKGIVVSRRITKIHLSVFGANDFF